MNIFTKIFKPNQEYVELFKKIKAFDILIDVTGREIQGYHNEAKTNYYVSIVEFYTFRSKLITAMFEEDEILASKKNYVLDTQRDSFWGYYWIRGIMEDAFNKSIKIDPTF